MTVPAYRRSARTDFRMWLMLAFGIIFFWAGSAIDPRDNCSADGRECAPWLVLLAQGLGAMVGLGAALHMLANPNRGSRIDPATGDLVWWQGRVGASGGDEGRIHPSRIGKVKIIRQDDSDDSVSLHDLGGERLAWFNEDVIPWPYDRWAGKLAAAWPHILVESVD